MRSTLTISPSSWHGWLYNFWRRHAVYKVVGYTENLCHYMRVVLFWAPIALFLHAHPKRAEWLRPSTALLGLAVPTSLVWASILWPGDVLAAVFVLLAILIGADGLAGLFELAENNADEISAWFRRHDGYKRPFLFAGRVLERVYDAGAAPVRIGGYEIPRVVPALAALWLLICALNPILFLWSAGAVFGAAALAGLVCVGILLVDAHRERSVTAQPSKGATFAKVSWRFVVAKKHRVCPLIRVAE